MMAFVLYCFIAMCMSGAALRLAGWYLMDQGTAAEFDKENFRKLAIANNDLALNIHRELASRSKDNIFFSPLSISTAFGMLYYGTKEHTAKELRKVLGYETAGLPEGLIHLTFQKYQTEFLPSHDPSAYVLKSANALLVDKHLALVKSYKTDVEDLYKASVRDVDFATHSGQILSEINDWVKDKTNGKIEKLLEELDPATVLIILNAVYFKGTWKTQFDSSETRPGLFFNHGLQSGSKEITAMKMSEVFSYTEDDDVQVLELPYKGENISMIILLPKELNGLEKLEKSMTLEKLSTFRHQFIKIEIDLTIPKFKVEYFAELSDVFQSLGAEGIFAPGADFSGIISTSDIFVTDVLHKAVFEVNEEGSEAAGVTAIFFGYSSKPQFNVNRPFFFAIVDIRSEMILFQGRVTNL